MSSDLMTKCYYGVFQLGLEDASVAEVTRDLPLTLLQCPTIEQRERVNSLVADFRASMQERQVGELSYLKMCNCSEMRFEEQVRKLDGHCSHVEEISDPFVTVDCHRWNWVAASVYSSTPSSYRNWIPGGGEAGDGVWIWGMDVLQGQCRSPPRNWRFLQFILKNVFLSHVKYKKTKQAFQSRIIF